MCRKNLDLADRSCSTDRFQIVLNDLNVAFLRDQRPNCDARGSPLWVVKRTSDRGHSKSVCDPKRTSNGLPRARVLLSTAARPLSAVVSVLAELSRRTESRPAQRTQAKPGPGSRIVRARSRRKLRGPMRSILQPISDSRRRSPSLRPCLAN